MGTGCFAATPAVQTWARHQSGFGAPELHWFGAAADSRVGCVDEVDAQMPRSEVHRVTSRRYRPFGTLPVYPAKKPAIAPRSVKPSGSSTRTSSTELRVAATVASLRTRTRCGSGSRHRQVPHPHVTGRSAGGCVPRSLSAGRLFGDHVGRASAFSAAATSCLITSPAGLRSRMRSTDSLVHTGIAGSSPVSTA